MDGLSAFIGFATGILWIRRWYDLMAGQFDLLCGFGSAGWYQLYYNDPESQDQRDVHVENAIDNLGILRDGYPWSFVISGTGFRFLPVDL